jgi:hypothetical protein
LQHGFAGALPYRCRGVWSPVSLCSRACSGISGHEEARAIGAGERAARRPDISLAFVRETHLFGDAGDFAHYLESLRLAGLK